MLCNSKGKTARIRRRWAEVLTVRHEKRCSCPNFLTYGIKKLPKYNDVRHADDANILQRDWCRPAPFLQHSRRHCCHLPHLHNRMGRILLFAALQFPAETWQQRVHSPLTSKVSASKKLKQVFEKWYVFSSFLSLSGCKVLF